MSRPSGREMSIMSKKKHHIEGAADASLAPPYREGVYSYGEIVLLKGKGARPVRRKHLILSQMLTLIY